MLEIRSKKIRGYEKVVVARDPSRALHAVIAVHSTALGPSLGGVRMWPFRSEREALRDCLRLAQAMTYKAAISRLQLGGGKAVVIGDPARGKSRKLFLALGEAIESLEGLYIAAEDSGIGPRDLDIVAENTAHVTGTSPDRGGSGDPSTATARGLVIGMERAALEAFGSGDLGGVTVALQGLGQVGLYLAKLLGQAGARLVASDLAPERCRRARRLLDLEIVSPDKIHRVKADIFSPCALGGSLRPATIRELTAKVVAGGANNQFENERRDPVTLMRRGILHAPDYVINAGGLIQLYVKDLCKKKDLRPHLERIGATLEEIFARARAERTPPLFVANRLAQEKIKRKTVA